LNGKTDPVVVTAFLGDQRMISIIQMKITG